MLNFADSNSIEMQLKLDQTVGQLKQALGITTLRQLGDASGFVIRKRTITADRFVPSMIKSMGTPQRRATTAATSIRSTSDPLTLLFCAAVSDIDSQREAAREHA